MATLVARPDAVMLELGVGGELLLARMRAALSALALLIPLASAATGADVGETVIGLAMVIVANVVSQVWFYLARQRRPPAWLSYATCTYDVSVTTGVLMLMAAGDRVAGMNSIVAWTFYLIAIVMTALRNDGRLVLYVGALSIAQYAGLVWLLFTTTTSPEQLLSPDYGAGVIGGQLARLLVLLMMTALTLCIVYRMQRLVELSGRDGLTGLPNRMWLTQQMPRLLASMQGGGSLTAALIDLDRFRRVNDEIGRIDGDRALRHVVAVVAQGLHGNERLVRLGGEEFVALLHCPLGTAWERTEQLRRLLWDDPFQPGRGIDPQRLSFSAGLAAWPQDGDDLSALLSVADRRLQASKHQGGNRVMARDP
ncbi:MAG: GGDEF domain-containing protein [Luteimonas sp.]